jgi:aminopeptidase N
MIKASIFAAGACVLLASCVTRKAAEAPSSMPAERDIHSYAQPDKIRVKHLDLDCEVLFDKKILKGTATLAVDRSPDAAAGTPLILDTRDLSVDRVEISRDGSEFREASFEVGPSDKILGAPLTVKVTPVTTHVRVQYSTSPTASGLQWLEPAQTAGKNHPYLFSQSEAIHARSWIPLQDSPAVRFTYNARVRTPSALLALMSAENDPDAKRSGDYSFKMPLAIPSYLMAMAVGDIVFRPTGNRTGVYAERPVIDKAAREFEDAEKMIVATEALYGPYRWGRYDILVLPPSFPIGGMENPKLTFATPTVIVGDKSLVSLVSHELAHSWSGNLVTNATWSDFWLNEGFTTYIEWRIQERIYGQRQAEMEAVLARQTLDRLLKELPPRDQILHIDLAGRDPDDGATEIPYIKGALFLRTLEENFGRDKFDDFLRGYFAHFGFQSITTRQFLDYLKANLLDKNKPIANRIPIEEWIFKPGLPEGAALPKSDALAKVQAQAERWYKGELPTASIDTAGWTTQEWQQFLVFFENRALDSKRMAELDRRFQFTKSGNSEIEFEWLLLATRNGYRPADKKLEEFLVNVGRQKFVKPLYEELLKTPEGRTRAEAIFAKAKPGYHPITASAIAAILTKKQP